MRLFALWTSVATIVALNIVLWLGLLDAGDTPLFGAMLTALHAVLPISSVLMLVLLVRDRHWTGTLLIAAVIIGMLVVATLRLTGPEFSRGLHLGLDLCALNAYLIVVGGCYRSDLARRRSA